MKAIYFFTLLALMCGCASEKTGAPSSKVWYQPGKSAVDTMRDLAACQNEAAAYGQGSFMRGEDKVSWAIVDSMAESSRENKIVETCMVAKGYSLVDKNSPLLSQRTTAQGASVSSEIAAQLLGHWTCVSPAKGAADGGNVQFEFLPENRIKVYSNSTNSIKQSPEQGRYYFVGSELVVWSEKDLKPDPPIDFSVTETQLTMMITMPEGRGKYVFERVNDNSSLPLNQTAQPPVVSPERTLVDAYLILATGDRAYEGRRVNAMHKIEAAAKLLGMDIRGYAKGLEPQVLSDDKLREARGLLEKVLDASEIKAQPHASQRITEAINQINIALYVR